MVTTRSGKKTITEDVNYHLKTPTTNKQQSLEEQRQEKMQKKKQLPTKTVNEVIEDLYVEALDRAKNAERELAYTDKKCKELEYELMLVRNEHVYTMTQIEKMSKNRQFYFVTWLSCSFLLQALYVYFAFRGFSFP